MLYPSLGLDGWFRFINITVFNLYLKTKFVVSRYWLTHMLWIGECLLIHQDLAILCLTPNTYHYNVQIFVESRSEREQQVLNTAKKIMGYGQSCARPSLDLLQLRLGLSSSRAANAPFPWKATKLLLLLLLLLADFESMYETPDLWKSFIFRLFL